MQTTKAKPPSWVWLKRQKTGQRRANAGNLSNSSLRDVRAKPYWKGGVRGFRGRSADPAYKRLSKTDPLRNIGSDRIARAWAGHRPILPNVMGPMMNFPMPGRSPYVPLNGRTPEYLDIGRGHIQPPSSGIYGLPQPNRLFNG